MRFRLLTSFMLVACATSTALAEDLYTVRFDQDQGYQWHVVGFTTADLVSTDSAQTAQGYALRDVESYYDASGTLRHDATWQPPFGILGTLLVVEQTLAEVQALFAQLHPLHYRIEDLSSYLDTDGVRRYSVVFAWHGIFSGPSYGVRWGQTLTDFISSWQSEASAGRKLDEFDTYLDSDGERRYDSIYIDAGSQPANNLWILPSAQDFLDKVTEEENNNLGLNTVETFYEANGQQWWIAHFDARSSVQNVFVNLTRSEFLTTVIDQFNQDRRIADMEVVPDQPRPSWENYGAGWPGTQGVPSLTVDGVPELGQNYAVELGNSKSSPSIGMLFVGFAKDNLLTNKGGTILVDPFFSPIFLIPSAGLRLDDRAPSDPTIAGLHVYLQTLIADDGASNGLSFSRGLDITYGRWQ